MIIPVHELHRTRNMGTTKEETKAASLLKWYSDLPGMGSDGRSGWCCAISPFSVHRLRELAAPAWSDLYISKGENSSALVTFQ